MEEIKKQKKLQLQLQCILRIWIIYEDLSSYDLMEVLFSKRHHINEIIEEDTHEISLRLVNLRYFGVCHKWRINPVFAFHIETVLGDFF